ncbi:hypothetical protein VPMG_00109 [Vibrio phage VBP32]|uniref:Metallopeptidase domain protein n=2 Tax=Stoningtonvirus VBP47 TaxID=2846606 RepID=M4T2I3_9CAUD|nr:HNH endonuclease [Vibrio phage VBP47]YP_007676599.1 HNH endonuclease [Vibrio phage VBP32]AGH57044.1 hypothetical protein VPNG_00020 [Vibrio phage VBP47]AGH57248.1 hypothetical protein VPMG_00109 [Vibrio phage VBP32]WMM35545.1 hypothetical protein [Vibrio phage PJN101]
MTITKEKALDRAKIGLLQVKNSTFISTILFNLKFSWDSTIPTACTNGLDLRVNPDFFMNLDKENRIFLLAHEAWHVAFQHMSRLDKRKKDNFNVWNQATDHYINIMLINAGYKMIQGGLADHQFHDQQVWSSDKIFDHLMDNPDQQQPDFEPDFGQPGDGEGDGDGNGPDQEAIERKIEDIVVKASVQSKMAGDKPGSIPGDIEIALDKLLNPKLPWNVILQNYMSAYAKDDFSWRKPNRRYLSRDMYMPSLYSEAIGHIACAVDTSCSVTDQQFQAFRTEIVTLQNQFQPETLTVCDFDTSIHKIHKLHKGEDASHITFHGRGGTNMHPVFEHYNKPENKPKVLIVFSDMECAPITDKPDYDVIWVRLPTNYGFKPDFGTVIDFDV